VNRLSTTTSDALADIIVNIIINPIELPPLLRSRWNSSDVTCGFAKSVFDACIMAMAPRMCGGSSNGGVGVVCLVVVVVVVVADIMGDFAAFVELVADAV
jgi:hypothetical protein